ncbi:peptide chain release factor N(5)-glutamine methyltransferase [Paucibacter sp. PLA-PC-4]|uniref:peptide chain release factor N(5)-glutamine methyltransferase n=1 Tax=Paucibacter sp. PLA-PC-4 TaxID=2993655 RepID=UPI002248AA20|nr:peptide chain release factor N(5)-glutamine methyltransferase [Paucibacter sp. PLA-PC-4]MCX2861337.1 peptide chain release factor N(5)-glutamine methyltransferase [Paucibacter sp. PLA-PC-4]
MSVATALVLSRERGLDRLEAQLLLAELLDRDRSWLITHDQDLLSAEQASRFEDWLEQRLQGVPLAYLCGHKEFHGLRLRVNADTLVPRPDTEVLVDWALELLQARGLAQPDLVDLGTGSGAIALALKHRHPQARVTAVDLSAGALAVARANAHALRLGVEFQQGDWWRPLGGRRFDLIVSNPPYIAGTDPHLPALRHEPQGALTPGGDGLSALQTLITGAPGHLRPGAWLLLEHGYDQAEAVGQALAAQGFERIECRRDLGGQPRVSGGRWPG